jgi:hypothetical protein
MSEVFRLMNEVPCVMILVSCLPPHHMYTCIAPPLQYDHA